MSQIFEAVKALWPPRDNEKAFYWRRNVFLLLVTLTSVLAFHLLGAKGHLDFLGIDSVANASDVKRVQDTSNAILYAIYAPQIRAKIRERCDTTDAERRERINQQLDHLLKQYEEAAGRKFEPMPRCDEV